MPTGALWRCPSLLVVAEDLQLDGEVDLADLDARWHASTTGAKFKMLVTPALTSRSAASWAAAGGVAITPIDTVPGLDDLGQVVDAAARARRRARVSNCTSSMSTTPATGKPRSPKPP